MKDQVVKDFEKLVGNSITISGETVKVVNKDEFRKNAYKLAEVSALESGERQGFARFILRAAAQEMGIVPASINDLYIARGKGKVPYTFTVPAMNMRVLGYDAARAAFSVANKLDASAIIFEIARSEMTYCDQRPMEYVSSILAAAITEGYTGPVFIQGDHFQISAKRYLADPKKEIEGLKELIRESVAAGFYNIDIDTSTLVDLEKTTIADQQKLNVELSAIFTEFIRSVEPKGITISVGGEIGEVGGHNSTEEELRAYLDGFRDDLKKRSGEAVGLSKISIQTGTSHGGVVLPDGTIAKVNVDFDTMKKLSAISRSDYGMGGAVQHGASTLPEDAFHKFVESEACEIHLATNFMNMFYDRIPKALMDEMYAYLREKHAGDRKPDMTDEQFYYKTRKYAVGPFKKQAWNLDDKVKAEIRHAWEAQFTKLFTSLGLAGTRKFVEAHVHPVAIKPKLSDYVVEEKGAEDVKDLAD